MVPSVAAAQVPDPLASALDRLVERIAISSLPSPVAVVRVSGIGLSSDALVPFEDALVTRLSSRKGAIFVDSNEVTRALTKLTFRPIDLDRHGRRQAFSKLTGARVVLLLGGINHPDSLDLSLSLYSLEDKPPAQAAIRLAKTDNLLRLLGEPIPGTLTVRIPSDSKMSLDGAPISLGQNELVRRVSVGQHTLRIEKPGYPIFTQKLDIKSDAHVKMHLEQMSNAGVPFKSFLASAAIPGLGLLLYGRPKSDQPGRMTPELVAGTGALMLYAGAIMYGIDLRQRDRQLTADSRDRLDQILKYELIGGIAGYAVNLIGALAVGAEYAERNKQLVRVAEVGANLESLTGISDSPTLYVGLTRSY